MEYRKIGSSDIRVSEVSFGCWTMGGLNFVDGVPNGWANVDEDEITAGTKVALDSGVNHFDNADVYGNGRAERMLARVLKRLGIKNEELIIASKVGHHRGCAEHAYEPAHIRHQCEQSLINLDRDYLDLYYFHHGDFGPDNRYLDDAVDMMNRLVDEGKVRVKGLSAYSIEHFLSLVPRVEPQALQSWAHAEDMQFLKPGSPVQQLMEERNLSFVAFSPLGQGRLLDKYDPEHPPEFEAGDHRRGSPAFQREALLKLKGKLAAVKEHFGDSTEDLVAVALNYVLAHDHVACVIPGFRRERQARCNIQAAGHSLSLEDVAFVRDTFGS